MSSSGSETSAHQQNLGILISGRGSNMQAIIQAIKAGRLNANVHVVISNKKEAKGLELAREHGIPTAAFSPKDYPSKEAYEADILSCLNKHGVGLLILAGYMRLVGPTLLNAYENRMLNIHPSLLPKFKGLNAQKQALESGDKESGCTVHVVDESLDGGPILSQERVEVHDEDTEESLSNRILEKEHVLFPETINKFIQGEYDESIN